MGQNVGKLADLGTPRFGMGLAGYLPSSRLGFSYSMERPPRMNILLVVLFVQPLVLVTLYLYVSGVFPTRRAFRFTVYSIVLAFFALSLTMQISSPGYDLLASTALLLSEVLPES